MAMRRHELSDEEWAVIAPLLPNNSRGIERVDDRRVINGILWRFRTGSSWRDVPERYGPRTTLYNRFSRWRKAGVWDRLLDAVSKRYDGDILMIDSSCVRVHQMVPTLKRGSADPCMGRSRGGLTTKMHALVDADGRPVRLELTAGQAADAPMAEKLLGGLQPGATILADKAYNTDAIRDFAMQRKCWANIPAKSNRKQTFSFSRWVYRQRNLVERFFNRIKQMRGLATRYDRRTDNYLAALKLAATRIWIASTNESVA
ncbi:IS5 family transposase [Agrobacterium vaccinii]|uniref:IS5 family transposase n=1 Tax=Agrobacterium vaccinii TaxID=2735528 RepID=UPI003D69CED9